MRATTTKAIVKKILIIEDEADMCLILDLMLNREETSVDHVKSLAAAKDFLKNDQPSLILLDNRLPDGIGIDFLAFLKQEYPQIRIIMISGADKAARDVALESGADRFLAKPFTRAELVASVQQLLN